MCNYGVSTLSGEVIYGENTGNNDGISINSLCVCHYLHQLVPLCSFKFLLQVELHV